RRRRRAGSRTRRSRRPSAPGPDRAWRRLGVGPASRVATRARTFGARRPALRTPYLHTAYSIRLHLTEPESTMPSAILHDGSATEGTTRGSGPATPPALTTP